MIKTIVFVCLTAVVWPQQKKISVKSSGNEYMTGYCYFNQNRLNSELCFQQRVYKQAVFCLNSLICKHSLIFLIVWSLVEFPFYCAV